MSAPQVISAVALSDTSVRVTFDQGMMNTAAFRLPSNYVFSSGSGISIGTGFVTPESVTNPTYVDISLNNEMTGGATYTVTVATNGNVQSAGGETLDSSFNAATFIGSGTKPRIAGATSLGANQARITFNEDMLENAAYLNVANYTFSGGLVALSILSFTSTSVTVSTNTQIGILYTATVNSASGIQDDSLNPLDSAFNTASFVGLVLPPAPKVTFATATATTIRVHFDNPMVNNNNLRDSANYQFTPGAGGALLSVSSVTPEAVAFPSYVDLFTGEQTDGISYVVTVNNVISQTGAPIDTSNNSASFVGIGIHPRLVGAVPSDSHTIRLTFDEPIRLPSGLTSPIRYSFNGGLTIQTAMSPPASSQPNFVDIVFNQEMIEGFSYTVTASTALTDLKNNTLDPSFDSLGFSGLGLLPYPEHAEFIDFSTIVLRFDEDMLGNVALISPANYSLDNGGIVNTVTRLDGRRVSIGTINTLFGTQYNLTVSAAITDLGGNPIDPLRNTVPVFKLQLDLSGAIDIKETHPINVLDAYNDGYAAEIADVSNGVFALQVGGSAPDSYGSFEGYTPDDGYFIEGYHIVGTPFEIGPGNYEFDYDAFLDTNFGLLPDIFYIGTDFQVTRPAAAVMDDFRISNTMLLDTRPGESLQAGKESITKNAQRLVSFKNFLSSLKSTLVLIDFEGGVVNSAPFIKFFTQGYFLAEDSVNSQFGQAIRFITKKAFVVDNNGIFSPNEGAMEFWIRPLIDTYTDEGRRYYLDLISSTSSNRMSIYKNETGKLVWEVIDDNGQSFRISCRLDWKKLQWHRVSVTWNFNNSVLNTDSMHMVVDNQEVSGVFYGTSYTGGGPILYGSGLLYGDCAEDVGTVRGISNATIRFTAGNANPNSQNINVPRIVIGSNDDGTDIPGGFIAMADMDNLRISNTTRTVTLLASGFAAGPGSSLTLPVIADNFTTSLQNFTEAELEQNSGATLLDQSRGAFDFTVVTIDSFNKVIGDATTEKLITDLINVIKPAHTRAQVEFTK